MPDTLIATISGIRGIYGAGLDPAVLVTYAAAYGTWARRRSDAERPVIVVGRDARVTGEVSARIVQATLQSVGCDVVDAGLATTPTVEMAVIFEQAAGGIILSASHNPAEWNALKLLNERGEFLSPEEAEEVLALADAGEADYVDYQALGALRNEDYLDRHIDRILDLDYIDPERIARAGFTVVVDGINSVGAVAIPALLRRIGLSDDDIVLLNGEPTGLFAHTPEPLPENLTETIEQVRLSGADVGFVVDPDADRLAIIADGGEYLSEELTQVIAADFLWRKRSGPFVTNLSSSRAIEDVAARYGAAVYRSAVGEINVVKKMQAEGAILGGEGNGGVIVPELHYGRDALVGVAMVLQHMAEQGEKLSTLRADLPRYVISKDKLSIDGLDPDALLARLESDLGDTPHSTVDGLKIDLPEGWVHLRKSNTEPIIRVYAEAETMDAARALGDRFKERLLGGA